MNRKPITADTIAAAERLVGMDYSAAERAQILAKIDEQIGDDPTAAMLTITNFTGHPSLTLPAGFLERPLLGDGSLTRDAPSLSGPSHRMPHGITLWGRLFDEGTLCAMAMALEAEFDLGGERPPTG